MVKVFISQPMQGIPKEIIESTRDNAINQIKEIYNNEEVVILDSYFPNYNPTEGNQPIKYLAKAIEVLAEADVMFMCNCWDNSRGCTIEHTIAAAYNIPILEEVV